MVTNKIILKATQAMDMCFHWLCNHEQQQQFWYYWHPGKTNYTDYWTKHHSAAHHKLMQTVFLMEPKTREKWTSTMRWDQWWHHGGKQGDTATHNSSVNNVSSCKGAGIPKIPNPNSGQWTDDPLARIKKTPNQNSRQGKENSIWEANRYFHVEEPASSGKTCHTKILLTMLSDQQANTKNND